MDIARDRGYVWQLERTRRIECVPGFLPVENQHSTLTSRDLFVLSFELTWYLETIDISSTIQVGFFAELGPLRIFVSTHLLPPHYKFQPDSNPPELVAQDQVAVNVVKGTKVRLRIVGARMEVTEIFAIGTMKEDYLGEFHSRVVSPSTLVSSD